jgi:hypothetical protein
MLDVVAETVIEKILSKAVKEFNMPQNCLIRYGMVQQKL